MLSSLFLLVYSRGRGSLCEGSPLLVSSPILSTNHSVSPQFCTPTFPSLQTSLSIPPRLILPPVFFSIYPSTYHPTGLPFPLVLLNCLPMYVQVHVPVFPSIFFFFFNLPSKCLSTRSPLQLVLLPILSSVLHPVLSPVFPIVFPLVFPPLLLHVRPLFQLYRPQPA